MSLSSSILLDIHLSFLSSLYRVYPKAVTYIKTSNRSSPVHKLIEIERVSIVYDRQREVEVGGSYWEAS
jgi:hypothetical protein